ncbi:cytochrome c family protein [Daejeonella oryzae]|uniref:hypothetical protein n=1 Tax=Daejeonella oryzae TaxID=1122943 RepID=UPI00042188FE|nr:hypothetical protein [Daejeonella oryzae]
MKTVIKSVMPGFIMLGIFLSSPAQAQDAKNKAQDKVKNTDSAMQDLPYSATYSSKFEMGDPAKAQLILHLWKDWDDNALERHSNLFADTVTMNLSDGSVIKGKDQNLSAAKEYRSTLLSAKSTVNAYMSLRSVDKNENWVAIWGVEEDTHKDGKKTMSTLHEIWKFNKDGKIDWMRQFHGKLPDAQ